MKKTLVFIIIVILAIGLWWFFAEDVEEELDLENGEEVEMEEEIEDPYEEAEAIVPVDERNVAIDNDLTPILESVFEDSPKLIDSGDIRTLTYVVSREITSDDVVEIRELLTDVGYETTRTDSEEDFYELDISITEEVLEEKYDGDFGGNPYIEIWTTERGEENGQMIIVKVL